MSGRRLVAGEVLLAEGEPCELVRWIAGGALAVVRRQGERRIVAGGEGAPLAVPLPIA